MKVGIILPIAENSLRGGAPSFTEIRADAIQADAVGFDSLWIYDHLLHRFDGHPEVGFWEAWTMLSAVAVVTERVALGTWVLCAAFRNPALLAKMAVTLDEVSAGRLILGLGAGWHEPEFDAFGFPYDHRVDRFEEALKIIVPLLRTGRVDFTGRYHRARDCHISPPGPRPAGPPLMIGAFGPRMLALTARYADSWNIDWLGPPEEDEFTRRAERREQACLTVGRDPETLAITGSVTIAFPELGELPGWLSGDDGKRGENEEDGKGGESGRGRENGESRYLSGSAGDIAAGLRRYADLGVAEVMCACYPHTPAAIARLGEAVALFQAAEDTEDTDRSGSTDVRDSPDSPDTVDQPRAVSGIGKRW
jgi:alkanesulfonate monooxygenase SsuD/methylene tetrahydromethanopterin reductase-like flavin-dependent oxidoreductase (luciferase family)